MHDQWRDGLRALMQEILPLVNLIRSKTTVREEQRGLVRKLKNTRVRPADISFRVDHSLGESHWRTPIQSLLFDVTTSNSVNDPGSYSEDARIKLNILQLQDKEKEKFLIEDKKNKKTGVTVTGKQIMRDFNARKYAFIPAVISPYGKM